jgi:hypothetical protein
MTDGWLDKFDALDLYADVSSNGVSIHMDGDREAEMWVEGPDPGGEVHNGDVYEVTITGQQHGVKTEVGFFIPAETLADIADRAEVTDE